MNFLFQKSMKHVFQILQDRCYHSLTWQYFIGLFLPNVSSTSSQFPLCLSVIFAHASFRLRNMKNKLENKIEGAGLKRSPMGILLEALGQQEENFQKIQSLLEEKLKEWLYSMGEKGRACMSTRVSVLAKDADFLLSCNKCMYLRLNLL